MPGYYDREREDDAARKQRARKESRTHVIPPCEDPARRAALEADDIAWLMHYFGDGCGLNHEACYWYPFTEQQLDMSAAIGSALSGGGDKALAASRGEGKTTLAERLAIKYVLSGRLDFVLICCSTGTMAEHSLESIRDAIETNDRLLADYPEVCVPVRQLEGVPQRAKTMLVTGRRHDNGETYEQHQSSFGWTGDELIFPDVPGSPSSKAIIATRGLDAAVRGIKRKGKRVKLVIIDDPDTLETAINERQAEKLEARIDKDLAGLGGQTQSTARVMLTTLQSVLSASYKFTDQKKSRAGVVVDTAFLFTRQTAPTSGMSTYLGGIKDFSKAMNSPEMPTLFMLRVARTWTEDPT